MTQSSFFLTNGSSLEDCHTNFFALADLCGIKWRQYTCEKNYNDLIEDPILNSYAKCIGADLLCVWRRVRLNSQDQPNRGLQDNLYVNYAKELWIFWYGDEPDFSQLISSNLIEGEQGSWESFLSYECRTLLFKALHNLIERCLLSRGYARLGRWFFQVKHYDLNGKSDKLNSETQVTFAFNFFLHGDSNVCANVDVRQHSFVYRISNEDIQTAQSIPGGTRVILAPYGLQGYLTGFVYKDSDSAVQKFLSEWKKIYPLVNLNNPKENSNSHISPPFNQLNASDDQNSNEDNSLNNKIVEIIIGDYKMKYPINYIFITEADKQLAKKRQNYKNDKIGAKKANFSESFAQMNKRSDEILECNNLTMTPYYNKIPSDMFYLKSATSQAINFCDSSLFDTTDSNRDDNSNDYHHSYFNDLLLKNECHCKKCQNLSVKKHIKSNNNSSSNGFSPYSSNKSKFDRNIEKEKAKLMKNSVPFHHRSLLNIDPDVDSIFTTSQINTDSSLINSTVNINANLNQLNSTPIIMPYKSPVSTSTSSILNTPGIESSPLSNFNLDTTDHSSPMPSKDENGLINTSTNILNQITQNDKEKSCIDSISPNVNANECDTNDNTSDANSTVKTENSGQNLESNNALSNQPNEDLDRNNTLKRSFLYKNIYDDSDHDLRNGLLYDFSTESVNWDIPLQKNRRHKQNSNISSFDIDLNKEFSESLIANKFIHIKNKDPYEFNDFDDHDFNVRAKALQDLVNGESNFESTNFNENPTSGIVSDLNMTNKIAKVENETICSKVLSNTKFIRDDDFAGSFSDMDIFNSSGEESNENFQTPLTPKIMNGHSVNQDSDSIFTSINNSSILCPAELSRMFPTPPSLEAMVSSPCNTCIPSENKNDKTDSTIEVENKIDQTLNSIEIESKDWSFVYKPPIQSTFITSTKYAPLDNIEFKRALPPHFYYKHNNSNRQQIKNFNLSPQSSNQSQPNQHCNKPFIPDYLHITPNKISAFPNSMIRNVRPTGQNNSTMNTNYNNIARMRMKQPPLYSLPTDNFNNFRQNSPSLHIDNTSMSPMTNNFISSPAPNFDHKSPFPFSQSINSPSNTNALNSPSLGINNYNIQQKMSPMVGQNMYPTNTPINADNNINGNMMGSILNESNSLMLNLLLSDSMFNLFRDHNFESCSICVCNMNIKGSDVGIYLPDNSQQANYDSYPCTCGFSAVTNRNLSQFSGLFYEDEVEITGIYYDPSERKSIDSENGFFDKDLKKSLSEIDENLINLITSQSTNLFPSCSTLSRIMNCDYQNSFKTFNLSENSLQLFERDSHKLVYKDYTDVTLTSLNMSRIDPSCSSKQNMLLMTSPNFSLSSSRPVLHDWQFRKSNFPVNNHEVIYMLKSLQPLMQESVQRKGSVNEVTYNTVKGPLTWRQFHRLAGRGTEYQCEPQPIPSLLVGHDKDCVAVSPFALKFWEKLSLEPYAITRDVGYIVLAPNDDYIQSAVRIFFKELTTTYEILRFGRHVPLNTFRDGICFVGSNTVKKSDTVPLDDWFNQLGESSLAAKIRLYAQACYNLVPNLSVYDKSLFELFSSKNNSENMNCSYLNNTISHSMNGNISNYLSNASNMSQRFSHLNSSESQIDKLLNDIDSHSSVYETSCQINAALQNYDDEDNIHKYPAIVIYIVEPFASFGKESGKLGCIGLLKSFSHMLKYIPENLKNNIHLQLLSINSIVCNDKDFRVISRQNQLKELAFSVYSQCKQQLIVQPNIKSLTGLGPAASFELFFKGKDFVYNITQLYTTPYILAPLKDKQTELGEMFGDNREKSQILFCCYCLTEDQRWLIATCTNDKGDILQSKAININVPNRTRRRNASVTRFGLDKLMKFIQAVMSESVSPWRLVIGRLGRIGHGELKDWTFLMSKKSLLKYSRQLREMCPQCRDLGPHDQPAINSACLISLEADTALRVFPNYYTPDERFSSSCNTCSLSTPEDSSCTHILVFPTSATTQSSHANFSMMDLGANLGEEFFANLDDPDIPVEDGIDLFENFWNDGLLGSPHRDGHQPDSPSNRQSFGASNSLKNSNIMDVDQDESTQLLQQPLALAFYVSTARTGPLPRWFWANCPHLKDICPSFLKSALLIHTPFVQQNSDDLLHSNNRDCHPLDSSLTTDVLRCALEGYNSLSWLALDPATHDRMSCLPIHIQVLMQLYHSVQVLNFS